MRIGHAPVALVVSLVSVALSGCLLSAPPPPATMKLGDPAPPLQIAQWVKGGPVDLASGKGEKVYVIDFWATWCAPCVYAISHLCTIQEKFRDQGVVLVGVSAENADIVSAFVDKAGNKINYVVAADANQATSKAYIEAFGLEGIPHSFVVDKSGAIVWEGHPLSGLDGVLTKVLDGTYDVEAAQKIGEWYQQYVDLAVTGENPGKADEIGEQILKYGWDPFMFNRLSWDILTNRRIEYRNLDYALRVAKAAYDASDGQAAEIVDTYARAFYELGDLDKAIEYQQEAVALVADYPARRRLLRKTLEQYEAERAEKKG